MTSGNSTLRERLTGAWEMLEYYAYLPDNPEDRYYPMGPDCGGMIMYSSDGYMSAQLITPGQRPFTEGTDADWATVGRSYIAYTGAFYLDETGDAKGPFLYHQMQSANIPRLLGDIQRRLMKITEENGVKILTLAPDGPMKIAPDGLDRILVVRWRKMPDNSKTTAPPGSRRF